MTTAREAVAVTAALRSHEIAASVLARWVYDLDGRIRVEIHGEAPDALRVFEADLFLDLPLAAPAPFDDVYWKYLVSMIDFSALTGQTYTQTETNTGSTSKTATTSTARSEKRKETQRDSLATRYAASRKLFEEAFRAYARWYQSGGKRRTRR